VPLLVLRLPPLLLDVCALAPPPIHQGDGPRAGHQWERLGGAGCGGLERRPLAVEERLNRLPEIFDQMKPIHHLHGMGCSTVHALGIERPPVATDDEDGRMLREPGGHALRRALGQQGKHPLILQIDQAGSIALPAPPGPRIAPKHLRGGGITCRRCLPAPPQGVWTGPQPQPGHETRTGLSAKRHAEGEQELGKPFRPTRPRGRHSEQALGENLARARRIGTEKLAPPQLPA
jgi:hypothetical protein